MKLIVLICLLSSTLIAARPKVFSFKEERYISADVFYNDLPSTGNIILGEYHYNALIQNAEGEIIQKTVQSKGLEGQFTLAWEFLSYAYQSEIDSALIDYKLNTINSLQFLAELFPKSKNPEQNITYLAPLDIAKKLDGQVLATNALRVVKSKLMKEGRASLTGSDIPREWIAGTTNYYERFAMTMRGHVPEEAIRKYFLAQVYTDNIIADKMFTYAQFDLRFLIIGSFHSDYGDGVVNVLKENDKTVTVKIIDTSEMSQAEILKLTQGDANFGNIADYLYFVSEKEL